MAVQVECPICNDQHALDAIRSIPCGHTACEDCLASWSAVLASSDSSPQCPVCRAPFSPPDIRRIYLSLVEPPSAAPADPDPDPDPDAPDDAYVKHARHIAKRLAKMGPDAEVRSVERAAQEIGRVALVNSARAQSILWDAVAAFWLRITPLFRQFRDTAALQALLDAARTRADDAEKRADGADKGAADTAIKLKDAEKAVEQERTVTETYVGRFQMKREEARVLREENADLQARLKAFDVPCKECTSYQRMLAELKAAECKVRADLRALKQKTRQQAVELQRLRDQATTSYAEEESLFIEPPAVQTPGRRHGLDVYAHEGDSRKRRKIGDLDTRMPVSSNTSALSSSSPPPSPSPGHSHHRHTRPPGAAAAANSLRRARPQFASDWTLGPPPAKKPVSRAHPGPLSFPLVLDARGRAKGTVSVGPRVRMGRG